ncbi:YheC/YheD family protein [Paenibacillus chartarius]|uniref:YheC/YheD family protein n=1 Tax=Paenibacillus chartarius TaxID=747481 RepID=A0ABV6DS22_9BACL
MNGYKSRSLKSKWVKTKWLIQDSRLQKYVPETSLYSKNALQRMVSRYPMIYFKPTGGTGGRHIAKIVRLKPNRFRIQKDNASVTAASVDALHRELTQFAGSKSYLIQQGIYLKDTGKRPFDVRVMVQKRNNGAWTPSAIFTKIGKPHKVATNYHAGGQLGYLEETLRGAGYSKRQIKAARSLLETMGRHAGACFDCHGKGFRELGLDVAMDRCGRYWILEVNTRPQFYPLKHMKDKALYQRIIRLAKEYGRTS